MTGGEIHEFRHPSAQDQRLRVPPQLFADVDRVLRDHGLDVAHVDLRAALAWLLAGQPRP